MEVTVTKFERHLETQQASVTFSIKKLDTGFATTTASLVELKGTDDEIVKAAWENAQYSVNYWLSTEKQIVGSKFTVAIPESQSRPPVNNNAETVVNNPETN